MKQGNGGYAPSYNAQISTDERYGIIVGAGVSQSGSDYGELLPSVDRVEESCGEKPDQVVADGGFTSRANVVEMSEREVDFVGSLGDHQSQSKGQMKRRGIQEGFGPEAFEYHEESDTFKDPPPDSRPKVRPKSSHVSVSISPPYRLAFDPPEDHSLHS